MAERLCYLNLNNTVIVIQHDYKKHNRQRNVTFFVDNRYMFCVWFTVEKVAATKIS